MTSPRPLRIGARGSPLSLAQTGQFRESLAKAHPGRSFEIVPIVTTGDKIQDRLLIESGGKGLFTKELDEALLDGRIDLAVHSMKDLPTQLPEGIALSGVPQREDPRDALISNKADRLQDLPSGARIGTASLRRQAQLLSLGLGFDIVMLRGNVETRLRKVASGDMDATLLAYAGLRRLGLSNHVRSLLDPEQWPPAAGQGALAVTSRADDLEALAILGPLNDQAARLEITAERAFLAALDGSCRTPIGALGRWADGQIWFIGETLTPDGEHRWRRTCQEPCADEAQATEIGLRLGGQIRAQAGDALYTEDKALAVHSL